MRGARLHFPVTPGRHLVPLAHGHAQRVRRERARRSRLPLACADGLRSCAERCLPLRALQQRVVEGDGRRTGAASVRGAQRGARLSETREHVPVTVQRALLTSPRARGVPVLEDEGEAGDPRRERVTRDHNRLDGVARRAQVRDAARVERRCSGVGANGGGRGLSACRRASCRAAAATRLFRRCRLRVRVSVHRHALA
jgi:hypothetical protein